MSQMDRKAVTTKNKSMKRGKTYMSYEFTIPDSDVWVPA